MINTVEKMYNEYGTSSGTYKVTNQDGTILWVPNDETNSDYQEIQKWIAKGNTVIDNPPE